MMGLGLLCLVLAWVGEPAQAINHETHANLHARFWSNLLHNCTFFTMIGFMLTFVMAAFTTAYAGWHTLLKRLMEAFSLFIIPGIILMLLIGLGNYFHFHHLYEWSDKEAVLADKVLSGKASFLNPNWYFIGTLVIGGLWIFFATKFRELSVAEDKLGGQVENFAFHRKIRFFAAIFLPVAAFTGPAMVWQWVMSVDAHWYSTLFAWYSMASAWLGGVSLLILTLIYLKTKGYFGVVTKEHIHDLAKFMFAFSIFWTYCWFSQYMLIWYGNVGEETIYFKERLNNYPVLFYGNLVINFILPFLILMRNTTKRRTGTLVFTSILVFVGHWWDYFYMLKPGILLNTKHALGLGEHGGGHGDAAHAASGAVAGFTFPGFVEIGIFIGFLGFFLYWVFSRLTKASLVPANDPYYQESLHHEVQPFE